MSEPTHPAPVQSPEFPWNPAHKIGTCARCGEEMVLNVPRMGAAGGFIHKATRDFACMDGKLLEVAAPVQATPADRELPFDYGVRKDGSIWSSYGNVAPGYRHCAGDINWPEWAVADLKRRLEIDTSALAAERDALSQQLERVSAERMELIKANASLAGPATECEEAALKVKCLVGYIEYMLTNPSISWPLELGEVITEAKEWLTNRALAQTPPKI